MYVISMDVCGIMNQWYEMYAYLAIHCGAKYSLSSTMRAEVRVQGVASMRVEMVTITR